MLPQPKSRFLTINGLRLHYLDWGNPTAPPLVCVHGFATSAHTFNGMARRFRDRFHIVATDLRGHGDSGHAPPGAYEYTDHLADLEGMVDALDLQRFTLVGSSLGGRTAMMYADLHPERVERLVINDVGPVMRIAPNSRPPEAVPRPKAFSRPEEALPYLRKAMRPYNNLSEERQLEQARGLLKQREDGVWVWKLDQEIVRQRRRAGSPPPVMPDMWAVVGRLQCPALVIRGKESHLLDEEQARRMVTVLPRGELVEVAGVGHTPWLTEPEAVAALERFLTEPE